MNEIKLNYRYRYPRVMFRNGETKYGMLYGVYNKAIKKLEYYFADASQMRKINIPNKEMAFSLVQKLQNKINPQDILRVDYLN